MYKKNSLFNAPEVAIRIATGILDKTISMVYY